MIIVRFFYRTLFSLAEIYAVKLFYDRTSVMQNLAGYKKYVNKATKEISKTLKYTKPKKTVKKEKYKSIQLK